MLPEFQVTLENPLVIKSNFPQIRERLLAELEKYKIEVTEEALPEAKRAMAELSDLGKKIDRARIDYAKQFKAPITAWEAEAKQLFDFTNSARDKIAAQVKLFDDKRRALCSELMLNLLASEYNRLEVRPEYATGSAMVPNMIGISHVTKGGQLTKEARENIQGLAMQGRAAQDKADGRMARIEADCRAAGVEPLSIEHCRSFIDADDRTFEAKKTELIGIEVKRLEAKRAQIQREEEAKAKAKADQEAREAKEKEDRERAKAEAEKPVPVAAPTPAPEPARLDTRELPKPPAPSFAPHPSAASVTPDMQDKEMIHLYFHLGVSVLAKKGASKDAVKKFIGALIADAVKSADSRISECAVAGVEK